MSRDIRMLPIRTVGIILTVAGVLAAGVIIAQSILTVRPNTDLEMPSAPEVEDQIAVETEADTARRAPSAPPHRWLPDEIGAGLPGIVVEDEGVLGAEDDVMSLGRYLEGEHVPVVTAPATMEDFMRQKLTETQADDAPVGPSWPGSECEPAPPTGPQPC